MDIETFESLVDQALEELPEEFREALDNVSIVVRDWPTERQLRTSGTRSRHGLLGLYEGVPQIERGDNYNLAPPDTITLFRKPILEQCQSEDEVRQAVAETLRHEIAHHFGTDEEKMKDIERQWRRKRR